MFILGLLLLVRTAVDGPNDLPRMIAGIPGSAEDSNLAAIPASMGTQQPPPMALLSPSPFPGFGIRDRVLDLFLGVARPTGHRKTAI